MEEKYAPNPLCPLCGVFDELVLHVLRDCLVTKNMWKSIVPGSNHISFFPNSLDTWVFENILARARFAQGLA